jgi:hypothetical protein
MKSVAVVAVLMALLLVAPAGSHAAIVKQLQAALRP